jgi:hypothetical protein
MSLSIRFLEEPVPSSWLADDEQGFLVGVTIGDFYERDTVLTGYWQKQDYINQWYDASQRLLTGGDNVTSAYATAVHDPIEPNHGYVVMCWPTYRVGDKVFMQNAGIPYDRSQPSITIAKLYDYVPERKITDDVSEWELSVEDIQTFSNELKSLIHHP